MKNKNMKKTLMVAIVSMLLLTGFSTVTAIKANVENNEENKSVENNPEDTGTATIRGFVKTTLFLPAPKSIICVYSEDDPYGCGFHTWTTSGFYTTEVDADSNGTKYQIQASVLFDPFYYDEPEWESDRVNITVKPGESYWVGLTILSFLEYFLANWIS